MTPEQWQRTQELFFSALEQPTHVRAEWPAQACAEDELVFKEVEAMLAARADAGDFLQSPALAENGAWFQRAAEMPLGERRVGPYQLVRELGRGGMGAVFLAERADGEFKKLVAIKLIKRGMDTDEIVRRFRHERQILASLEHPNIAQLLDGGTTEDGLPYFVMEYIEGLPIDQYCKRHSLGVTERLQLFLIVCFAVQHAHQKLVVHRDLKPGNILVTEDGAVKLLDFGIAKLLDPAAGESTLTSLRPMTPEYASPEQLDGQAITTASDVYSLGVALYELLTGTRPYRLTGSSSEELARAIRETEPVRPSLAIARGSSSTSRFNKLRGFSASDLDNITLKALHKDVQRRYASVEQFAEDIRRYLTGRPVSAHGDTLSYRASKFFRRNRLALSVVMLVILSLSGGLIASTHSAQIARAAQARAEREGAVAEAQRLRAEEALLQAKTEQTRATQAFGNAERQRLRAEQAQTLAETERARSERRFNEVRQLANAMLSKLYSEIRQLPGSTKAQAMLVTLALEYLDRLSREASGDPEFQRELAAAYDRVGAVQGNSSTGELGDLEAALRSFRQALRIRQTLAQLAATKWRIQYELAVSHRQIGEILAKMQKREASLASYRQALPLLEALAADHPQNNSVKEDLVRIHRQMGMTLNSLGNRQAGLPHIQQAQAILLESSSIVESHNWTNSDESEDVYELALLLREAGDLKGSLAMYHKWRTILEARLAKRPASVKWKNSLGEAHLKIGDLLRRMDRTEETLVSYRSAVAIYTELPQLDPADARLRQNLSTSHNNLADSLKKLGRHAEALKHFELAVELEEALVAQHPDNTALINLTRNHASLADLASEAGNAARAEYHFRHALDGRRALVAREPSNLKLRLDLGESQCHHADALRRTGKLQEAIEQYRQALAVAEAVDRQDTAGRQALPLLSTVHYRLGDSLMKSKDFPGALEHLRRAATLREVRAAQPGASVAVLFDPTVAYSLLSELHVSLATSEFAPRAERIEHWKAARAWHQKSLAIYQRLQQNGLLPPKHTARLAEAMREMAKCDEALAKLQWPFVLPGQY